MTSDLHLVELTQTCSAAPSQWEGRLNDGRVVYIRYRHGKLTVRIGPEDASVSDVVSMEPWFVSVMDDTDESMIDIQEVCDVTGLRMAPDILPFCER